MAMDIVACDKQILGNSPNIDKASYNRHSPVMAVKKAAINPVTTYHTIKTYKSRKFY